MRSFKLIRSGLGLAVLLALSLRAETFQLNDGRSITGEIVANSANDVGLRVRVGESQYEKISWSDLSQESLKKFKDDKKLGPFVEPFIEIPQEERLKKTEVVIKDVPRLSRPAKVSLLGSLFGSSVGLICLLLIYAANIYAGYEVGCVRAYPPAMTSVVAAVAPIVGPAIFLCLPTRVERRAEEEVAETPAETLPAPAASAHAAEHAGGGHRFAHLEPASEPAAAAVPQTQVFQRGQFTFNRRFIETKFSNFFGMARREADKEMVLLIKTPRGEFAASRISRIASNDMHVEVRKGAAAQEVQIPFGEIQEIQLKHKDA